MVDSYLGQIRMVVFNVAPPGHASCDGQLLPISQNPNLFTILGTTYGGDGITTFALPDLRGRTPIHVGPTHVHGSSTGEESHSLTASEVPSHTHDLMATNTLSPLGSTSPGGNVLATGGSNFYGDFPVAAPMGAGVVSSGGAGLGHDNMSPFLVLNFVIALSGTIPA